MDDFGRVGVVHLLVRLCFLCVSFILSPLFVHALRVIHYRLLPTIHDILVALQYRVAGAIVSRRTSSIVISARKLYHYVFNQPWTMFKRK